MTYTELIRYYHKISASEKYILGFDYSGIVYYVILTFKELRKYMKEDHESSKRGHALKVRIRVSADDKKALLQSGTAIALCEISQLIGKTYNKGDYFEKVITETLTGTIWVKNSIPCYQAGDIIYKGEQVQVKYDSATLISETTAKNFKNALRLKT